MPDTTPAAEAPAPIRAVQAKASGSDRMTILPPPPPGPDPKYAGASPQAPGESNKPSQIAESTRAIKERLLEKAAAGSAETPKEAVKEEVKKAPETEKTAATAGVAAADSAPKTDKQIVKEAVKEVVDSISIADLKADPQGVLEKLGVTLNEDKLERLAAASRELRQRESDVGARSKKADEALAEMAELKKNPIGWIRKNLGDEGYNKWTRHIAENIDPPGFAEESDSDKRLSRIEKAVENLATAPQRDREAADQRTEYAGVSKDFFDLIAEELGRDANAPLNRFWDTNELNTQVKEAANQAIKRECDMVGRELTPAEMRRVLMKDLTPTRVIGRMSAQLQDRLKNTPGGNSDSVESQITTKPAQKDDGPNTLTTDLADSASRSDVRVAELKLPRKKQLELATARVRKRLQL